MRTSSSGVKLCLATFCSAALAGVASAGFLETDVPWSINAGCGQWGAAPENLKVDLALSAS
jgi:hypothetical protein